MSKRPTKIEPKAGLHLRELCKTMGIPQSALSEITGISENTISKIINGRSPMTPASARIIQYNFPNFRYDWIMGLDDLPYEIVPVSISTLDEARKTYSIVVPFLKGLGFQASQVLPNGVRFPVERGILDSDWPIEVSQGEKILVTCSVEDFWHMAQELCEFAEFKIHRLHNEGSE